MDGASVAIIGAAGRFPGARNLDEFWQNLIAGVESLTRFTPEQLQASSLNPAISGDPNFVPVTGVAPDVEYFDEEFFGISPGEARLMCPQHRVFLEHCWEAFETAAYDPRRCDGRIGVFAGSNASTYLLFNILSNPGLIDIAGHAPTLLATDKDYLATRVSYALDLRGPSVAVNTACSTSLVAVHMACQSLLSGECDMALAGAATVHTCPGYLHQIGLPLSPDGRCRPFDRDATGSGIGSGAGVVLLKPLAQARRDRDRVLAIIRGSATNNDGAGKVSYTAPSIRGEEDAIAEALAIGGIDPRTVSYIEAHGTATPLGDPIEIEALSRVFRRAAVARGTCAIGSVKSNLGHLGAAAGIAGLLKVVLAMQHHRLPPSLNFHAPNPKLGLDDSPFRVVTTPEQWSGTGPLRAGVSSFGVGGSNSHVVLEAPEPEPPASEEGDTPAEVLTISARSAEAAERVAERLAAHLTAQPELPLADVAYTLHAGRALFKHRLAIVARSAAHAARCLNGAEPAGVFAGVADARERSIAFLFPGGGAQHIGMARTLYAAEPVFRDAIDRCDAAVKAQLGTSVRDVIATAPEQAVAAGVRLDREAVAAAAIFATSWSLAMLWKHFGIEPDTMAGYSTGEYVAATLAGVMTVEEAISLQVERIDLIERELKNQGAMLSVPLSAEACQPFLDRGLSLAGDNGPQLCVLAGPRELIEETARDLEARGVSPQPLRVRNGYHSSVLDPILPQLRELMRARTLRPPARPWISTVTGATMRPEEATDPDYWVRHTRQTVRFGGALSAVFEDPHRIVLEVGPGVQMASLARQHGALRPTHLVLSSLPHPRDVTPDREALLAAAGRLWVSGRNLTEAACGGGRGRRVSLPTYPFQRRRHWIEQRPVGAPDADALLALVDAPALPDASEGQPRTRTIGTRYAAARTAVESALVELWERALGQRPIGVHDDFFELGGTSLLAIQLLARLPPPLKGRIQMEHLLGARTIATLAARLDDPHLGALPPGIVQLREGSGDPVFCPHPLLGGPVAVYEPLLSHLPPGRPFYGFVAAGLDGIEPPRRSIEAMSAAYVRALKQLQAEGPYHLLGFSTGGLIAFDIARRLSELGDQIPSLVLIDARAAEEFDDTLRRNGDSAVIDELLQPHVRQLVPAETPPDILEPMLRVARATVEATLAYKPPRYDGPVTFIVGDRRDNPFLYPTAPPELFWRSRVARLAMHRVPGNHYSLMATDAAHVARQIAPLLQP